MSTTDMLATFDYTAVPGIDEGQAAAMHELVRRHARDAADEALLLDALGFGPPPPVAERPAGKCEACGYSLIGRNHKSICGPAAQGGGPRRRREVGNGHGSLSGAR